MVFVDISPFRFPNFRLLFLSQLISMLGSQMTMITIPFQVYALTGSTFQTGLVSGIELVCLVSTALWGGVLADRLDRRRIIVTAEIAMMTLVLVMAVNAYSSSPSLWVIYILAGVLSGINGFHRPAFEALTPLLIPKTELPKVSSLMGFKFVTASLAGPTIAGLLVATVGPVVTYLVDASSFGISLALLMRITGVNLSGDASNGPRASLLKEIAEGARYIYSRKDVLGSYIIDFFAMVFCMPQVLFPAFAQHYGLNTWLGALYTSIALGGLLATLVSRWTSSVKRIGVAISCAAGGWAFAILCIGVIPSFWALPVGLFVAGACDGYSGIFRMTMWNESIPDNYRGRIASFSMLSYTSGPLLGNTLMGFFGDLVGLHQALALGGAISLVAMALVLMVLPAFWRYRSPEHDITP
jgi:MFS family permease